MNAVLADIEQTLEKVARRQQRISMLALTLQVVWISGVFVAVAIAFDLIWPLPWGFRVVLVVVLLIGMVTKVYRVCGGFRVQPNRALHVARRLETYYDYRDNPLTNALCLMPQGPLSTTLAKRCIDHAKQLVGSLATDVVIDRSSLYDHAIRCVCVLAVALVIFGIFPQAVSHGVWRFTRPLAGVPSYHQTRFDVEIDPNPVPLTGDAVVTVTIAGAMPDTAYLTSIDEHDKTRIRWPMTLNRTGQFVRRLVALRRPMVFRIETPEGYSRQYHIEIAQAPLSKPSSLDHDPPFLDELATGTRGIGLDSNRQESFRLARSAIDELTHVARRLGDQANHLIDALNEIDARPIGFEHWSDQHKHLVDRLHHFTRRHASILQRLSQPIKGVNEAVRAGSMSGFVPIMRGQLSELTLPHLVMSSVTLHSEGKGDRVARVESAHEVRRWLQSVREGAFSDLRVLREAAKMLDRTSASPLDRRGGAVDVQEGSAIGIRMGVYHERVDIPSSSLGQTEPVSEYVPEAYRDLVARYFARLIEDQSVSSKTTGRVFERQTE